MGARYYAGDTGRFTSQDPVSLALGDWKTVQEKTGDKLGFYLQNPQTHNSYSYTANNPLKYVDQNGEFLLDIIEALLTPNTAYAPGLDTDIGSLPASGAYSGINGVSTVAWIAVPGFFGTIGKYGDNLVQIQRAARQYSWGDINTLADHAKRHGADFGVTSAADYAKVGAEFRNKIGKEGIDSFTDKNGVTRVYEESTNTFASYNKDGTTRTIYKPNPSEHGFKTNKDYWNEQKRRNTINN